jgi:hypothetical protein
VRAAAVLVTGWLVACTWQAAIAQARYIPNVPDIIQPPAFPGWALVGTWNSNHYCTPVAAANTAVYWDLMGVFPGVANQPAWGGRRVAGEYGWFMDTNDQTLGKGVTPDWHLGTHTTDPRASGFDAVNGVRNFAAWSPSNFTFNGIPYTGVTPPTKVGYNWTVTLIQANGYSNAVGEINYGRPVMTSFSHWDIFNTNQLVKVSGVEIQVWDFKTSPAGSINGSSPEGSWEQDFTLGHTVAAVGYFRNFTYDSSLVDLLIVHDGIPSAAQGGNGFVTPTDVAVVWRSNLWQSNINIVPEPGTLAALAVGVVGLLALRRRRR